LKFRAVLGNWIIAWGFCVLPHFYANYKACEINL